jgi:uncharacterized membrane protein
MTAYGTAISTIVILFGIVLFFFQVVDYVDARGRVISP